MPRHAIHPLLRERWSPRAMLPEAIPESDLAVMMEAARWAPSCFNAQPWRFVVAHQGTEGFAALLSGLAEGNQSWAGNAGALVAICSVDAFSHNGKPNKWSSYDTGAAALSFCLQATADGYATHQMGGFVPAAVATSIELPEGATVRAMLAVGRQAPAETLPDALAEREVAPRQRLDTIGWQDRFATPLAEDAHIDAILSFWFDGPPARWFKVDPAFDGQIIERFGALFDQAERGELASWERSARGRLALILLFDQFSRNMFRDTARMYGTDAVAVALTLDGIEQELDSALDPTQRTFFYMPLMHSEDEEHQELCVAAFAALVAEFPDDPKVTMNLEYAEKHLDIVARWGRFPHRNERLGRTSTAAEIAFLKTPGSSF